MRLPAFWKAMLDNDDSGLSRLETRQGILRVCEFYRVPKIAATIVQFIETQCNVSLGNFRFFGVV